MHLIPDTVHDKYKDMYVRHGLLFSEVHGLVMEVSKQRNIFYIAEML